MRLRYARSAMQKLALGASPTVLTFEQHRGRLTRLAHRMLGSLGDAEDTVQEAYLRWHQADVSRIDNAEAWLVTTTTRLAIDRLRAAQQARLSYVGPWLPEPWLRGAAESEAPDARRDREAEVDYALLVLLERLGPEERAAFLLREIFEVEYPELAEIIGRSEAATRQLVHRARERLSEGKPRYRATPQEKRELLRRFVSASEAREAAALSQLFAPDATLTSDGGGKVFAARIVLEGAPRITRTLLSFERKVPVISVPIDLAGEPALLNWREGKLFSVTLLAPGPDGIAAMYKLLNPEKLQRIRALPGVVPPAFALA